ncbi:FHA domain-containing protein [Blastopirellula sp. JC732]|uniref:FHA domain-containing protein n=1 Tax=Blastopirellula sediminis TaxID=2894196 RepID=A0A9X1MQL8_9BACT|nr:FHA domain-containing protein [Blastopirellula sediminis]MCC9606116.1 FHA domain-containing protein [Blastopirellula sediminis]MCC9630585.1 FHA domain-containing protein [Blastopirellula sediminis]
MSDHDRKWIIGASSDCDLVVDQQTVSGRHCALERVGGQWFVEDLSSTNGVYVNGERISERRPITRNDLVTLGKNVTLPWPEVGDEPAAPPVAPPAAQASEQPAPATPPRPYGTKITIGRTPGNDVVINHPSVSSKHAILYIEDGTITLQDLHSSNGTYLGADCERVHEAVVQPSDIVYFGEHQTTITDLLLSSDKTIAGVSLNLPPLEGSPSESADSQRKNVILILSAGGLVVLLGLILILFWNGPAKDKDVADNGDNANATANPVETTTTDENATPVSVPPKKVEPTEAAYQLMIADPEGKEHYRIGTAVAVGPRQLVTSATCKAIANLAHQRFPNVVLQGPTQPRIIKFVAHPTYLQKFSEGDDAERKFKELIAKVEKLSPEQDMQSQLREAYHHYMTIADQPHHFDVAVIEVDSDLPTWLPVAPATILAPQTGLSILSFAFDRVAPFTEIQSTPQPRTDKGRVRQTIGAAGDPSNPRLLVGQLPQVDPADHLGLNFTGAAILDSEKRLVALYSRITPARELNSPTTGEQFDATVLSDVSDFLQPYLPTTTETKPGSAP